MTSNDHLLPGLLTTLWRPLLPLTIHSSTSILPKPAAFDVLANPTGMSRRQSERSLSDESDPTDSESNDDSSHETDLTDIDADNEDTSGNRELEDKAWLLADQDHPPEYYLQQLETFDESEFTKEDYSPGSTLLLDRIEEQWYQYCRYIRKDPKQTYQIVSVRILHSFFDWLLNQRQGKGGRRRRGTKVSSSLGTYWKVYRLVYERATGVKLDPQMNRSMHKVLRKLAKKHGLKKKGLDKPCMYVEDLAEVLQTNLMTTEKRYSHGRHRIQLQLWLQLAGFTASRPQALLDLCYQHIMVTLLRDPEGGPHRVLLEFTFEFTKEYLGMKDVNTFPIPDIIYDPSLSFSPHVFLLGLLFADRAFAAYNLTSQEQLGKLCIEPGCNELRLRLNRKLDNIPVFRRSVRTLSGWAISPDQPLPYSTLAPWTKKLGEITGFAQVSRPYALRYGAGKAFNDNGNVSEALQNLMMQHANIRTFLKHYLSRRITADAQAIVRGLQPQDALMRAACTMSRSIDPRRPRWLTMEQSSSVNEHLNVRFLLEQREQLKRRLKGNATKHPKYMELNREISRERQRLRHALLKDIKERWDEEQSVRDVERQLAGVQVRTEVSVGSDPYDMLPEQKQLVEAVVSLPGKTLEEEIRRRNRAIHAVMQYCEVEEGGTYSTTFALCRRPSSRVTSPSIKIEEAAKASPLDEALEAAMVSVYREKRPKICFLCLGNDSLSIDRRVFSFGTPGDLSKHFKRKHLLNIKEEEKVECNVCRMILDHKMHLQNHALSIHGTVS